MSAPIHFAPPPMQKCDACSSNYSPYLTKCPNCGAPPPKIKPPVAEKKRSVRKIIAIIAVIAIVVGAGLGCFYSGTIGVIYVNDSDDGWWDFPTYYGTINVVIDDVDYGQYPADTAVVFRFLSVGDHVIEITYGGYILDSAFITIGFFEYQDVQLGY